MLDGNELGQADTRADTPTRRRRRGSRDVAGDLGDGGQRIGADAAARTGAGGGARDGGGLVTTMHGEPQEFEGLRPKAEGTEAGMERGSEKKAPETWTPAAGLATELGLRPAVVLKAAERAGAWRDAQGALWVGPIAYDALARHIGRTRANVERMAERARKRWRPTEKGCEVMRVEQIPGRHKVVVCTRLGRDVAGERVTVEVRDSLAYRVGEEITAKKGAWGWISREGR